jgi:hypothetical protein
MASTLTFKLETVDRAPADLPSFTTVNVSPSFLSSRAKPDVCELTRLGVDFVLAAHDDLTPGAAGGCRLPYRRTGGDLLTPSFGRENGVGSVLDGNDQG